MLTQKQHELLIFIHERIQTTGVSPSFEEMKLALDLKSKSGIHRLVSALEERGFLRRLPHRARAVEILKLPENISGEPSRDTARPSAQIVRPGFGNGATAGARARMARSDQGAGKTGQSDHRSGHHPAHGAGRDRARESASIPLLGRIAAGTPIEAIQHEVDQITAPGHLLGGGDHYALEVQGESMIDAGIHDGDIVFIQRCDSASNGEIVVALVDDQEATLKRLRKKGASIALEAENPAFETRIYPADRVAVQGRLVGLVRKY